MSVGKGAIGLIVAGGGRAHFDDLNVDVTVATEPARRAETVVQVLLAENHIVLGDSVVTLRELTDRLTQRFDSSQRLLLLVDKNMDYERVEQVLKAAVSVGFEKISIEMRK
jgi:biopolymer transport protein ExbD